MKVGENNHGKEDSGTLAAQIQETERQLMVRQHYAHIHANTLVMDLKQEMASPTTLLLASEFGFILGELTKRPSKYERQAAKKEADGTSHDEISPLKEALDIGSLVAALYQAIPLAWIMDTFHPEDAPLAGSAATVKNPKAKVDLTKKYKK
jgi:hypothetical protein